MPTTNPQPATTLSSDPSSTEAFQRRRIADCTCRLLAEGGLEGASLRKVARELNATTGMLTHYYPTKEALLEAALDAALADLARSVGRGHRAPESMDEWVEQFLATLPADESSRTFWRVLAAFRSASMTNPSLAEVARHHGDRHKPGLARLIALTIPQASPSTVEELTEALWLVVDGIGVSAALHGAQISVENLRRMLRGAWRNLLEVNQPSLAIPGQNTE